VGKAAAGVDLGELTARRELMQHASADHVDRNAARPLAGVVTPMPSARSRQPRLASTNNASSLCERTIPDGKGLRHRGGDELGIGWSSCLQRGRGPSAA